MSRASLSEPLKEFSDLQERAKAGELGPADLAKYHALRDRLVRLLLTGQAVGLRPGQLPRRSLRVARALRVELEFDDGAVQATTLQLSSGGFASLLASAPRVGEEAKVSLHVPDGHPIQAGARVMAVKEHLGKTVTSFQLVGLGQPDYERLEMFVFDAFLEQFEL